MSNPATTRTFLHGTTLERANAIIAHGPDPKYREPGDILPSCGFCVYDGEGPFPLGSPECYARSKAKNYPSEGGAVILELDIPVDIARLSTIPTGDYQFDVGHGITELLAAWLTIEKRIRILDVNP